MPRIMRFDSSSSRPKDIDLIIPGLGVGTGRNKDRFRASSETRDPKLYRARQEMIRELGQRLLFGVLRARLDGRITTADLHRAYREGTASLNALASATSGKLLEPLLSRYILVNKGREKERTRKKVQRFIKWAGGELRATTADLTTNNFAEFLGTLLSEGKRAGTPVGGATQNRYRAALGSFCSYLVREGHIDRHPIAFRALGKADEGEHRLPTFNNADYAAYFDALPDDGALRLVFRFLIHTGADIGEVLTRTIRDCDLDRHVARLRYKRTKTRTVQRLVPYPKRFVAELREHIEANRLASSDLLFGMLKRYRIDEAHQTARKVIGQPELRIKDFRHVAAIMWRRAGVDLESIRQWLGHATINQTVIYSNFAPDDEYDGPRVDKAAELLVGPSGILPFPARAAS